MAFPKYKDIEIPLLLEIEKAGGKAAPRDLYSKVAGHFSSLTLTDLQEKVSSGRITKWENMVRWARNNLCKKGHLARRPKNLWAITSQGRDRLAWEEHVEPVKPKVVKDVPVRKVPAPDAKLHHQIQVRLEEIGRILKKSPIKEFHAAPFTYDVVWKATPQLPPSHVFEVQDKGNLDSALVKLKHASDIWPCRLFLVVTGEKDRQRAKELLAEHFAGAFHEIADRTTILSPADILALHDAFSKYQDVMAKWT